MPAGERVRYPRDGSSAEGYLATGEGAGLGAIVLHERWGLVPQIEDVCDRLAVAGVTALAPDLFHGRAVAHSEPDEADRVMAAIDVPGAAVELSAAVDFLVDHAAVRGNGLGVIGFGMGGGLALWLAGLRPDRVRAAVPFYGAFPWAGARPDWDRITAAVEGHYAEGDRWATPDLALEVEKELVSRGHEIRLFLYPNVGHAFFDDSRPDAFDEDSARQAWVRTLEFLRAKLG